MLVPVGVILERVHRDGSRRAARRAFGAGFFFGAGLFGLGLFWLARLPLKELTHPWVLYPAHLVLVAYLSCFTGFFGLGYLWIRRAGLPACAAMALAWPAAEQLRSSGEMGFPWFSLGYAWYGHPSWIQWAAWGGTAAVSLWVVLVNGLLLQAWLARRGRARVAWLGGALLLGFAVWSSGHAARAALRPGPRIRVGIVQPNIASDIKWDPRFLLRNLAEHLRLTRQVAARRPDLILWPETAVPTYLLYDTAATRSIYQVVDSTGIPLLTGFPDWRGRVGDREQTYNSAAVLFPGRRLSRIYDKNHLVPFGERLPFQRWFPALGRLDFGQAEWLPGTSAPALDAGPARVGVLVCFESIFTEPSAREIRNGATLLANITNDEWFGPASAPWQHASMSVFRAVENRTGLVRCANTGVSFVADRDGTIHGATPVFEAATLDEEAELGSGPTWYSKHPEWLANVLLGAGLLLGCFGYARYRLTRRDS